MLSLTSAGFLHGSMLRVVELLGVLGVSLVVVARVLHRSRSKSEFLDAGLFGVTGRMGGGKSYFLAYVASLAFKSGRLVYANFPLKGAEQFTSWVQIVNVPERSLVLIDEAHLWWSSRQWRTPVEVESWITQLRKRRVTVFWASQTGRSVARRIRDLSFGIWECTRYKAGHLYTLYEPIQAGRETVQKRPHLARMTIVRKRAVMALYDTYAVVGSSQEWGGDEESGPATLRDEGTRAGRSVPSVVIVRS